MEIVAHLFRTEFRKLVSVLTGSFGIEHIELAEDIASETFLAALDSWPYKGLPANPTAWLYTVAKNKTRNHLSRQQTFNNKVVPAVSVTHEKEEIILDFSEKNIADSQLQMFFAVCHPVLSTESQICLALRILCGLGLNEIADAFLTNKETIHKRLQRAREKLRIEKIDLSMPGNGNLQARLDTVLYTIYLLFSEGYYSESNNAIIREELCIEALNLTFLLLENPLTNTHATNSLMSLLCFQSSRLKARQSKSGNIILYDDQDITLHDSAFIEKGFYYLQQASKWEVSSKYYLEASIAYWHTVSNTNPHKWTSILKLYAALRSIEDSPIIALNEIWPYAQVHGIPAAISRAEQLSLRNNHFYHCLLAELYKSVDGLKSLEHYQSALDLCKTVREKEFISKQMEKLR